MGPKVAHSACGLKSTNLLAPQTPGSSEDRMPSKGFTKPQPVNRRIKVGFTADEAARVDAKAEEARVTASAYIRALVQHDLGDRPKKLVAARNHATMLLRAEAHNLAIQIKKLGTNVNQMAHQVNSGMVPVTLAEMAVTQKQIAVAMDMAIALFEKVDNL